VHRTPRARPPLSFRLKPCDHVLGVCALYEPGSVEARRLHYFDQYRTLRKIGRSAPNRGEDRCHVLVAPAILDRDECASVQFGEVKGFRVRVSGKVDVVALGPALQIHACVFALILAFDRGRSVADKFHQLENAKGMIGDRGAVLGGDPGKLGVRKIGVRTREVEIEVRSCAS
jgi:hypothetical protein